jgi:hypothetical protein
MRRNVWAESLVTRHLLGGDDVGSSDELRSYTCDTVV